MSYCAKYNAQANLDGRTDFVDDGTHIPDRLSLRHFGGRILSAYHVADSRLFVVIHSQKLSLDDLDREFNFTIFDLAGQVISNRDKGFKTSATARKHCTAALAKIDAEQVTVDAIAYVTRNNKSDSEYVAEYWNN